MSLSHIAQEDFPRVFAMLDDTTPHSDSSGYETSVTTPTITNLAPNPRATAVQSGYSGLPHQWTNARWFGPSGATGTHVATTGETPLAFGTYIRKTWTAAAATSAGDTGFDLSGPMTVTAGQKIYISAYLRASVVLANTYVSAYWTGVARTNTGSISTNVPANTWTKVGTSFTVPVGATGVRFSIDCTGTYSVGSTLDGTGLVIAMSDVVVPYFDGSTTAAAKWTGSKNLSTSVIDSNLLNAPTNLFRNPSVETTIDYYGLNRVTLARSNEWSNSGKYSIKATRTSDVNPDAYIELGGLLPESWATLKPNTVYTMVGTARLTKLFTGIPAGSDVGQQQLSLFAHLNNTSAGPSVKGKNILEPQTLKMTFTTPSTFAAYNTLRAYASGDPGDVVYWDSFGLYEGNYTGNFFDGDSAGAAWSEAPNASISYSYASTPNYGTALVKGATHSLIIDNSNKVSFSAPIFKKNKEYMPWSVEAFVRPVTNSAAGQIQIFGNDGIYDGLVIEGNKVSFVTKYTSSGEARASFDVMDPQSMGLVGIHTKDKNQLYINGDLVAEVDITAAQQADTYLGAGTNLTSGSSSTTNALMVNAISLYDTALDDESVMKHYANAQDTLGAEDVSLAYNGALLEFAPEAALSPFFQIEYSSDQEWDLGFMNNVNIHDGTLYPVSVNNTSQAGYWETVIPLGNTPSTIYSANLLWAGTGATVTTSRDGTTWSPAQKGVNLSTITKGTNGEGQFLFVRVTFPGGLVNDPSYFDEMVFSLYSFGTAPTFNGREVVMTNVSLEDDTDVIDFHENWGAEMRDGTLTIKAGTATATIVPKTIEVWAKKGNNGTFTDNLGSAPIKYTNGGGYKDYRTDEWQLRHYVFPNGFTGDITFTGTGQIGHVMLYPEIKLETNVKAIYFSYVGKPRTILDVDEVIDVHEFNGAVDIYEYDWAIESSG